MSKEQDTAEQRAIEPCFVCGKPLRIERYQVITEDGAQIVNAGADCYRKAVKHERDGGYANKPGLVRVLPYRPELWKAQSEAYEIACEELESYQAKRAKAGKEIGTQGSLIDGMSWIFKRLDELEKKNGQ